MTDYTPSTFTSELLSELTNDRFCIRAWQRFLSRSWQRSLDDIRESPELARSFLWSAAVTALIGLLVLVLSWGYLSSSVALQSFTWWLPWYLLVTAFVLTHLGMVDDGEGHRLECFAVPNQLSFLRLALAPLIFLPGLSTPIDGIGGPLIVSFATILAMTDVLDGWIARRTGIETRLGRVLDYFGDLAFLTFLGGGLYFAAAIPASLLCMVIMRYPLACLGTVILYFIRGPALLHPTSFGKVSTFVLSVVLLLIACSAWWRPEWLASPWRDWLVRGLYVLIGANVIYLIYLGVTWNREPKAQIPTGEHL